MKNAILFGCFLLLANISPAQKASEKRNDFIKSISQEDLDHISTLGLVVDANMEESGFLNYKMQIQHEGMPVEGAMVNVVRKPDGTLFQAGHMVEVKKHLPLHLIHFDTALKIAMNSIETDFFYWESDEMEALIKSIEGPQATFYPKMELVWFDPEFSGDGSKYEACFKIDLFYDGEIDHKTIYVDATSGKILMSLDACNHGAANGVAKTRYHGEQNIITDSLAPNKFVLYDHTRGGGIETRNMRTYTKTDSSVVFEDDDNYWDHDNAELDNAATDVHWGSEMTYDYFMKVHGRNSFDGKGTKILSYVHHDENWRNASWNGRYARYGDGTNNPLTSIDIVAHELTHGVTGTSSKLIYRNESGALNESFSDIFGTAVEFYAASEEANWSIGKENFYIREMSNTKQFRHPNCYEGVYWYTGTGDNGGVHINSGVQNTWFYLLSTGGSGTNDHGNDYVVDSIGMDKAAQIAFRNLVVYLTPSSNHMDARAGSIEAAKDLFGPCSHEVEQVVNAWYAVGVGSKSINQDLGLIKLVDVEDKCEMGAEDVTIEYTFRESGCDTVLEAGTKIGFVYQINGGTPVRETLTLEKDMHMFDTAVYRFKTPADFTQINRYELIAWIDFDADFNVRNDSSNLIVVTHRANPDKVDVIGFEPVDFEREKLLFSIQERSNSRVEIVIPARKDGIRGLEFTGEPNGRIRDFVAPKSEAEIFNTHPEQVGKMCMCIDARSWADIRLSFDLRQTYSRIYYDHLENYDPKLMTSFRVTIDGVQQGEIYHPDTTSMDPWEHHVVGLDEHAGSKFELCFEGKHFISRTSFSSENVGDNSFLDNINISYSDLIPTPESFNVQWYPNPTNRTLWIKAYRDAETTLKINFKNVLGQLVYETEVDFVYGYNSQTLDLPFLANGLYYMEMEMNGVTKLEKLVIR